MKLYTTDNKKKYVADSCLLPSQDDTQNHTNHPRCCSLYTFLDTLKNNLFQKNPEGNLKKANVK